MKVFGNIIWYFPFLGFINAIAVWIVALLFALTIVGLPIAKGLFEFGKFLFAPFGNEMVSESILNKPETEKTALTQVWKAWSGVLSIIWILLFGIWFSIFAVIQIVGLFISIIGIPVGIVMAKSLGVYFNPLGKVCVPSVVKDELERKKVSAKYNL